MHIIEVMEQEKTFKQLLRANNERVSSSRIAIFHTLERYSPLTLPRLVGLLGEASINASTVYRNITLFRELGILNEIITQGQKMIELGDLFQAHHHHFVCRKCGSVKEFDSPALETALHRLEDEVGLNIESHHVELSGTCQECALALALSGS